MKKNALEVGFHIVSQTEELLNIHTLEVVRLLKSSFVDVHFVVSRRTCSVLNFKSMYFSAHLSNTYSLTVHTR